MAGVPEGFIMPTLGTTLGGNVMKATPTAEAIAGALGTSAAEIKRHKEFNAKKTQELESANLPGEMTDDIEIVMIKVDKYTTTPLRASNLSDPSAKFHNELSLEQQIALADLRERFRKNEHGSDTPVASWDSIDGNTQHQLITAGILYVEQLAAYKEHEYYKLGNGGAELVKRAQRHIAAKTPNKQEDFERQMNAIVTERAKEREEREAMEKRMFEMQAELAKLSNPRAGRGKTKLPKPGVQESAEA